MISQLLLCFVLVSWVGFAHVEAQTCGDPNRGSCNITRATKDCLKELRYPTTCAIGTVPTYVSGSCCPSCIPIPCATCNFTALPICADGEVLVLTNGCPSCKPHLSLSCTLSELPPCPNGAAPQIKNGCPTCRYSCDYDRLLPCGDNEEPTYNGYCPSCNKFVPCLKKCAAAIATIRSCDHSELPAYDPQTCCISCVVRNFCNVTLRQDCKTNVLPSLPSCSGNESSVVDPQACCISSDSCKCSTPTSPPSCTPAEILQCIRTNPRCMKNEIPCFNQGQCCPSCNSFIWGARLEVVAKCLENRRVCAAGEDASEVQGEPCQSCVPHRPPCTLTCNASSVCVFDWDFGRNRPVIPLSQRCVPKKVIILQLENSSSVISEVLDTLRSFTESHFYWYLYATVERYCSIPKNHAVCKAFKANIRNLIVELIGPLVLRVTVPEDNYQDEPESGTAPLKREISQTVGGTTLLSNSVSNQAATDVSFSSTASVTPTPPTNPPSSVPPGASPSYAFFLLVALCLSLLL